MGGLDLFGINDPGQIGRLTTAVPDRTGHTETGSVDNAARLRKELLQDHIKRVKIAGTKLMYRSRFRAPRLQVDNGETRICPTDIT